MQNSVVDLHNFANFVGGTFDDGLEQLNLRWHVHTDLDFHAEPEHVIVLSFEHVTYLEATPSVAAVLLSRSMGLQDIELLERGDAAYRHLDAIPSSGECRLLFEFEDGAQIEIEADVVRLLECHVAKGLCPVAP